MSEKKEVEILLKDFSFLSRFDIRRKIGQGSYGSVYKALDKTTNKYVAIKHMRNIFGDVIDGLRAYREINLLQNLRQGNIITLLAVYVERNDFEHFNDVCVILEFANSDLKNYIRSGVLLEMSDIVQITYQILVGLNYIHSAGVIHRDLKPANVLLFDNGFTKICDFGLSRFVDIPSEKHTQLGLPEEESEEDSESEGNGLRLNLKEVQEKPDPNIASDRSITRKLTSHVVTRWYRAPELILIEKNYDSKIDVWSLGCIFAELLNCMKKPEGELIPRKPFFPGHSCFPLSPDKEAPVTKSGFPVGNKDQLIMIVDKLGTPSKQDLDFISDQGALNYILSLPVRPHVSLKQYFEWVDDQTIDFLEGCLTFNPKNRRSIQACLAHPIFTKIRNLAYEAQCEQGTGLESISEEGLKSASDVRKLFVKKIKIAIE